MSVVPITSRAPALLRTDLGNAERLIRRHGADLHYVHAWEKWIVWADGYWRIDDCGRVHQLAKETARAIWQEAVEARDAGRSEEAADLVKHAMRSESRSAITAMLALAESDPSIAMRHQELDLDPWLLCVRNGTIDLRTGELRAHRREDGITKQTPITYSPHAHCPGWLDFLGRVFDGNEELIEFIRRAVGYSLTGNTSEQCLFFLYGHGANGKSTFLEVVGALLGEYAVEADFATFLDKPYDGGPRNDIARLVGARFVRSSEPPEGKRLAENVVKHLTGGEKVSARFLYREAFEFDPRFKLWLAGNHKPVIRGADDGIWRRIRLVPFTVQIPERERDPFLADALRRELPGILRWAVEGCLAWIEHGLTVPTVVKDATAAYRHESDVLGSFIEEHCELDLHAATSAHALYAAYAKWADESGEFKMSNTAFGRRLGDRGIRAEKYGRDSGRLTYRVGIRLLGAPVGTVREV